MMVHYVTASDAVIRPFRLSVIVIEKKQISNVKKTNTYTDKDTNEVISPCVEITFSDSKKCICMDGTENLWYKLEGVPIVRRTF